ncbi:MAG: YitT family protein [Acutalibacteraceae bacterium]
MSKKELVKRYTLFILGLFFSGIGVAFTKHGELGVSPVSSVANVMSYKFDFFSMGVWLIIWNCVLIVGQIVILRKDFKPYQLLQLPLSFLFGYFTDFGMWLVSFIPVNSYFMKLLMLFIGIVVLAFGISLTVIANVIMNSGEAFVKAISDKTKREFGNIKVVFDISCVTFSIILSLLFFDMKIVGTREGTILSAVLTGFVIKFFSKLLKNKLERILVK